MSDLELAEQVRRDRIDILIDLSGHTAHNRLRMFTYKPAPVSATWLGYFSTTGIKAIDYVICNRWLLPPDEEYQWVERPWYMPSAHWCYNRPRIEVAVGQTPAEKNGFVTFGCYNNYDKLNRETIGAWAEIMRRLPDCRMLLRSSNNKAGIKERICEHFAAEGFTPGERLTIDNTAMAYDDHMRSYGLLDIALDPVPYNGGTTTVEAFYMGVPVITRHGDRFVAHMSESNVRSAGLDEWVGADTEDYVRRAVAFASDVPKLAKLREGLREQVLASRLFDAKTFARDLDEALRGMWRAWCETSQAAGAATKSSAS
jgi:predicted O-linked N-acetylglucosamine transferase (SPINDLY family)